MNRSLINKWNINFKLYLHNVIFSLLGELSLIYHDILNGTYYNQLKNITFSYISFIKQLQKRLFWQVPYNYETNICYIKYTHTRRHTDTRQFWYI